MKTLLAILLDLMFAAAYAAIIMAGFAVIHACTDFVPAIGYGASFVLAILATAWGLAATIQKGIAQAFK